MLFSTFLLLISTTSLAATPEHKLFYVASPPYHGNQLLHQLFSTCEKVSSHFQNTPNMGSDIVLTAAKQGLTKTYATRKARYYDATKTIITDLPEGFSYVDTNPNFAHTYHDVVLRDFASLHSVTILLLRDHPARALSRLEQNSNQITFFNKSSSTKPATTKHNTATNSFQTNHFTLYTQHTRLATTRPLKSWKESTEKELLIGYLVDMESRRQQIQAVAARRRRVEVIDVWYDELTQIDSAKYLLETRLGMKKCNVTNMNHILHQHQQNKEKISLLMLENNAEMIESYISSSRQKVALSITLPSLTLPIGVLNIDFETRCLMGENNGNNGNGCSKNVPLLHMGRSNERHGDIFFWEPVQMNVNENPIFYFGTNANLPIPSSYGDRRDIVITTSILNGETKESLDVKIHSTFDSTRIIETALSHSLIDSTQKIVGIQLLNKTCGKSVEFLLCHQLPATLNISLGHSYHLKLNVVTLTKTWSALNYFQF